MINCTGVAIGGGGGGGLTSLPIDKCLFVMENGNDATALPDRLDLPYLTVGAAIAAMPGDDYTVIVYPGNYTYSGALPLVVRMYLSPGVNLTFNPTAWDENEQFFIDGFGDIEIDELFDKTDGTTVQAAIKCKSLVVANFEPNNGLLSCVIDCTEDLYFLTQLAIIGGNAYDKIVIKGDTIYMNDGIACEETYKSVYIHPASKLNGYVIILNDTGTIFNFHIHGDFFCDLGASVRPLTLQGECSFWGSSGLFNGFRCFGNMNFKTDKEPILVEGATIQFDKISVFHEISNPVIDDTIPAIAIDASLSPCEVGITQGSYISGLNGTYPNGMIIVDNSVNAVKLTISGKYYGHDGSGFVVAATTATQDVYGGVVETNLTTIGANTNDLIEVKLENSNVI